MKTTKAARLLRTLKNRTPLREHKMRIYRDETLLSQHCRAASVYADRYRHILSDFVTTKNLAALAQRHNKLMAARYG